MDSHLLRFRHPGNSYVAWDLETESLLLCGKNRPWQLFWLVAKGDEIREVKSFYLKWPDLKVSEEAARITHFDPTVVEREGVDPRFAISEFDKVLYDPSYFLVGHNLLGFDSCVYANARRELGMPVDYSWMDRLLDTNCLARGWKMGQVPKDGENLLAYQFRMDSVRAKGIKTSLGVLGKEFNIPHDAARLHDARVDTPLCFSVLKQLLMKMEI